MDADSWTDDAHAGKTSPTSLTRDLGVRTQEGGRPMSKHQTTQLCPICEVTPLRHVHCAHASCTFLVTTCPNCDREQAVRDFVLDHEDDCEHRPASAEAETAPFARLRRVA